MWELKQMCRVIASISYYPLFSFLDDMTAQQPTYNPLRLNKFRKKISVDVKIKCILTEYHKN